ncbi:hypothetical protein [Geodermatophilus marinus]|uniref:hypothetical protein n=1 Tax=Geodermatophilus sp. LHW52908 TaxID=2303986 RepID=UPI001314E254|nr:hypothetical protein [Geodermatophilus sp. LHW52908]
MTETARRRLLYATARASRCRKSAHPKPPSPVVETVLAFLAEHVLGEEWERPALL